MIDGLLLVLLIAAAFFAVQQLYRHVARANQQGRDRGWWP